MIEQKTIINNPLEKEKGEFITIFDGCGDPKTVNLNILGKDRIRFGRNTDNEICLTSPFISGEHGCFIRKSGHWYVEDLNSKNGIVCNGNKEKYHELLSGDRIRVDRPDRDDNDGVLIIVNCGSWEDQWEKYPLDGKEITIGRSSDRDIVLNNPSISRLHAVLYCNEGTYYIKDNHSTNGIIINDELVKDYSQLHQRDVITIGSDKLVYLDNRLYFQNIHSGIRVDALNVTIVRKNNNGQPKITLDKANVTVRPGELVAIIGGSGAGKSTMLNAISGYLPPASGQVLVNGFDLYRNFQALKQLFGYVPQKDIVYENLTVREMLTYSGELRLPKDSTKDEIESAVLRAAGQMELKDKLDSPIRRLSGGQEKRVSIAVELLSDPRLLYLDEPASGLDPGTEKNLMILLRHMADQQRTVILVTHSTLQLKMCDRIIFMGKGGKVCCFDNYENALEYFGIDNIVDAYPLLNEDADEWADRYIDNISNQGTEPAVVRMITPPKRKGAVGQWIVLMKRLFALILHDRSRLTLLLLQPPIISLLISMVASDQLFLQHSPTKAILFAITCAGFWIGMLNALQEICKERSILKREYMAGISLNAVIASKLCIQLVLCAVQSAIFILMFCLVCHPIPKMGLILPMPVELTCTLFLVMLSASGMGLFVSALVKNADRAMGLAPMLLMPQILFSGLAFRLEGFSEIISRLVVCRWGIEGLGTTAKLNMLKDKMKLYDIAEFSGTYNEPMFEAAPQHLWKVWGVLLGMILVFTVLSCFVLHRLQKED